MTVFKWSQTAASNDSIDSTINYREGQSPGSLNNSNRAMMAAIAKWRDDLSGNLVTGGTSTAVTVTTNQGFTSLTDGLMFAARITTTTGAAPTLAVDGLTAKQIRRKYGTNVTSGELLQDSVHAFTYDSTDDAWIVHNLAKSATPLADGGTGAALTDPDADRILFWDDSAGAVTWLAPSTGLAISGTNIALSHLGLEALTDPNADRIAFWDDSAGAFAWLTVSGLTISGTTITVDAATTSASGIVELATAAEVTTGTDAARVITPATQQAHSSAAKFWAYVTVSGGTPTVQASYNVTSITDDGLGLLTVTIATDFASANWAPMVTAREAGVTGTAIRTLVVESQAAGSVQIRYKASSAQIDPDAWSIVGFGAQ